MIKKKEKGFVTLCRYKWVRPAHKHQQCLGPKGPVDGAEGAVDGGGGPGVEPPEKF